MVKLIGTVSRICKPNVRVYQWYTNIEMHPIWSHVKYQFTKRGENDVERAKNILTYFMFMILLHLGHNLLLSIFSTYRRKKRYVKLERNMAWIRVWTQNRNGTHWILHSYSNRISLFTRWIPFFYFFHVLFINSVFFLSCPLCGRNQ